MDKNDYVHAKAATCNAILSGEPNRAEINEVKFVKEFAMAS